LAARAPADGALWFAGLIDQRRVETTNARGDDARSVAVGFDDGPSARRNAEINAKHAHGGNST